MLVKAVAQAVPAYAMSVFKVPQSICEDIQKAIARFWRGSSEDHRSIHWARWERLCHARKREGSGLHRLFKLQSSINCQARVQNHATSRGLVDTNFKSQVFQAFKFYGSKFGFKSSFVWRSILWSRQVLHKGSR